MLTPWKQPTVNDQLMLGYKYLAPWPRRTTLKGHPSSGAPVGLAESSAAHKLLSLPNPAFLASLQVIF